MGRKKNKLVKKTVNFYKYVFKFDSPFNVILDGNFIAVAKKKKFDEQIKQYDGAIMMMEEQKMMLENAESLKDVFSTVNQANQVLIESTKGFTVDDLDRIRDDLDVIIL